MKRGNRYLGNQTVLTIKHTEYIRDISPSTAFTLQVEEPVNPGLLNLFPWLGLIGQNFEEYKFHKLCLHFRSHSSDTVFNTAANGSTALGSVMMAFQYNVLSAPYINKSDLLNNATAVSTKPSLSKSIFLDLRHQPIRKLWIRTPTSANTTETSDRRLYDIADFHLATQGCQGTAGSIGELWVTSIVTFTKPTTQFRAVPFDYFNWALQGVSVGESAASAIEFQTLQPASLGLNVGGDAFITPAATTILRPTLISNFGGIIFNTQTLYTQLDSTGTWRSNSVFQIIWSLIPTGGSSNIAFAQGGELICALCREITIGGALGRTTGNALPLA